MARYLVKKQVTALPPGYTRLESIKATGSQYINTELKVASTDIILARFKNTSASGAGGIYGVYKAGESSALYANATYYGYDENNTKVNTGVSVDTSWHETTHNFVSGKLIIDNTETSFTPFTFTNTNNCPLFARTYNNAIGYYFSGEIAYWKVYRNGVLYMNLVPCKDPNDEVGMYDTVNGRFYGNSGSGSFVAGQEAYVIQQYAVRVTGKNLNGGTIENKGYTSTGGTSTSTTFAGTLWQIPCEGGQKYTASWGGFPDGVSGVFINTWNTDGTWSARQAIAATDSLTYTISAGIGKVNFTLYKTGGITIGNNAWIQVEKGATATPYEPYRPAGRYIIKKETT